MILRGQLADTDDLPPIVATCPQGHHWEWQIEDDDWRVTDASEAGKKCRQPYCENPAVAVLYRHAAGYSDVMKAHRRRWFCCEGHMYGRIIRRGLIFGAKMVRDAQP